MTAGWIWIENGDALNAGDDARKVTLYDSVQTFVLEKGGYQSEFKFSVIVGRELHQSIRFLRQEKKVHQTNGILFKEGGDSREIGCIDKNAVKEKKTCSCQNVPRYYGTVQNRDKSL